MTAEQKKENMKMLQGIITGVISALLVTIIMGFVVLPRQNEKALLKKESIDNVQNVRIDEAQAHSDKNSKEIDIINDDIKGINNEIKGLATKDDLNAAKDDIKDLIRSFHRGDK